MRLINTSTFEMKEFFDDFPPYAILSHTWEEGEVSSQDSQDLSKASQKPGYKKIVLTCKQAVKDSLKWCWVDTCCIDKTSSAELSEAINSMFAWYRDSSICYAYLSDFAVRDGLKPALDDGDRYSGVLESRWFTRGWTLQELLAPSVVRFYDQDWNYFMGKTGLAGIKSATGLQAIDRAYLDGTKSIFTASTIERMSWMATRQTTRKEDLAYCLLGIFEVNMPLLYGEGVRAFVRLQEEILKQSTDQSIFFWNWQDYGEYPDWSSIFAPSPHMYRGMGRWKPRDLAVRPYYLTNAGLRIWTRLLPTLRGDLFVGIIDVCLFDSDRQACILLRKDPHTGIYTREKFLIGAAVFIYFRSDLTIEYVNIYISTRVTGYTRVLGSQSQEAYDLGVFLYDLRDEESRRPWLNARLSSSNAFYNSGRSLIEFTFGPWPKPQHGFVVLRDFHHGHWYCFLASAAWQEPAGAVIKEASVKPSALLHAAFDLLKSYNGNMNFHTLFKGLLWHPMNIDGNGVEVDYLSITSARTAESTTYRIAPITVDEEKFIRS